MRELPIIFSAEMVKAILEGRKTQTRRIIKPQPPEIWDFVKPIKNNEGNIISWCFYNSKEEYNYGYLKPKYRVGDRLWVREKYYYGGNGVYYSDGDDGSVKIAYQSSRFMPKKYARIWLEVTGIRVERVQDISDKDAIAEGIYYHERYGLYQQSKDNGAFADNPIYAFWWLWDSINANRGYSWKSNPWVWVIEFKKIK